MIEVITYEQDRLRFFEEQLAHAERRLKWAVKNSDDHNLLSERGSEVSFYQWAVEIAEMGAEPVVRCKDCILRGTLDCGMSYECDCGRYTWEMDSDFCSHGERKDDDCVYRQRKLLQKHL